MTVEGPSASSCALRHQGYGRMRHPPDARQPPVIRGLCVRGREESEAEEAATGSSGEEPSLPAETAETVGEPA